MPLIFKICPENLWRAAEDAGAFTGSPSANARKGDRVVVRTTSGEVTAKEIKRKTAKSVELRALNPGHPDRTIPASEIAWIARVMWARQ